MSLSLHFLVFLRIRQAEKMVDIGFCRERQARHPWQSCNLERKIRMVAEFSHDLRLPTPFGSGNLDVAMLSGDFRSVPELKCHRAIRVDRDLVDYGKP